jgi:hypothetical protein
LALKSDPSAWYKQLGLGLNCYNLDLNFRFALVLHADSFVDFNCFLWNYNSKFILSQPISFPFSDIGINSLSLLYYQSHWQFLILCMAFSFFINCFNFESSVFLITITKHSFFHRIVHSCVNLQLQHLIASKNYCIELHFL